MAIIKCKMCGGDLEIAAGVTVAECEYCGTKQTLPKVNDEVIQNLFNRANNLRIKCEFDKAEQIYEKILQENDAEAEAHWGIVLCKYGIEYVEDPKTYKRIPTCHRTSYDAVTADAEYLAAIQYADADQRGIYEAEAKAIDGIQKNILNIVKNEKPFDVFICYKETDENGKRTMDSAIANDIYYQLTQEGLKVFYAAITLEDKLGREYEPYIFAALNSAKVMLVIGTKPQHFTAVWVKNEWSRFLKLMKTDRSKLLIPCYKDMDAYDLPEEFAHLQAQDMGKIGFINDVVRGIKKVTVKDEPAATVVKETVVTGGNTNTAPLLKRAFMFLEDGDWASANEYCEKVLDIDPENAQAYLGKLMAELQVKKQDDLKDRAEIFDDSSNYQKAIRFANEELKSALTGCIEHIHTRNENARLEGIYSRAKHTMDAARTESRYKEAAQLFETISDYLDSSALAQTCLEKAEIVRKDAILANGKAKMCWQIISNYESAIKIFESISGWKDADEQIIACQRKIEEIKVRQEAERSERERKAEIARKEAERIAKRNKKIAIISASVVCAVIAFIIVLNAVIIPNIKYNDAVALMEAKSYAEAMEAFSALNDYKDSKVKAEECNALNLEKKYNDALAMMAEGNYEEAIGVFRELDDYKNSKTKLEECNSTLQESYYQDAVNLMRAKRYDQAIKVFESLDGYGYSKFGIQYCEASLLLESGDRAGAAVAFGKITDYEDAGRIAQELWAKLAVREALSAGTYHTIGLIADGTVVATGINNLRQCDVSGWNNIVAISASGGHTVGLKRDGTVVAVGRNNEGQRQVSGWRDIVAISAGEFHTVGLKRDGTVVATGQNRDGQCDVSEWSDIVAISAGDEHTVGLKADGTVVAVGDNFSGECDVSGWRDIVAISAGLEHTVGLKADGTVVAVGAGPYDKCNVSGWKDIVAITAASFHTVGLKANGTVVAVGSNWDGRCDVSGWRDIVAISAGSEHTVGLKADGTVVAVGNNEDGQCDVSGWKDIKTD